MNRFLFFDIDGTLRSKTDYQISQSTYKALKILKKKGYKMGIATGRGLYSARMFAKQLDMDFVISDGGRCVLYDGKIIHKNYIDQQTIELIDDFSKKHGYPIGYSNHYGIHSTSDVFSKAFDLDQTIICSVKKDINVDLLFGLTKLYVWGDRDVLEKDPRVSSVEHHWLREKLCVFEYMHKDEGIRVLEEIYHIEKEDMVAFGDDLNDVTMFQHCGTSVCMGNGNLETQQHATYVTTHIDDDGIMNACLALNLFTKEDL